LSESRPRARAGPTATIVVLTHNGRAHLERCLPALRALDYPRDRYRVVVVDNASDDGSAAYVSAQFPEITLVRSPRNLGFAAGNNLGFARAPADFYVTLNDDTEVTPAWLTELIRPALADPQVGLCTGKLILMEDRLRVRVDLSPALSGEERGEAEPRGGGAYPPLPVGEEPRGHPRSRVRVAAWLDDQAVIPEHLAPPSADILELGIPVSPGQRPTELRLDLGLAPDTPVDVSLSGQAPKSLRAGPSGLLGVPIGPDVPIRSVIQNAGTVVFRDGRGRDRGAVVGPNVHYYADDVGQFDRAEEVFAGCGASLLIRATLLADIGGFDERFFMYYEDVDLSWRARLRGWQVHYAPGALVRHQHRGSSSVWSGRFVYYTERNRLLLLIKLAPADRVLRQLGRSFGAAVLATLAAARRLARDQDPSATWIVPRWSALASLAGALPGLLRSRAQIQARRQAAQSEIDRWLL
jgi:GT2 family glycosyltransferase